MSKLRRQLSTNTTNNVETRDLHELRQKTGNVYGSIAIIAKRANQINISIKEELHNKLEEFATHTDSLEEIRKNKCFRKRGKGKRRHEILCCRRHDHPDLRSFPNQLPYQQGYLVGGNAACNSNEYFLSCQHER